MNSYLKQSTASQTRATPPLLDDSDFKTAETGLTIANTDVKLMKNGGSSANKNSGGGTHLVNGAYALTFDATDTDTVGELFVSIKVAGALPVFFSYWVLEEAIYDALFGASAAGYGTAQTGDSFARIGVAGVGLSNVPWNAAWDAEVQSEATDALNAYDPPTRAEATSDKDEILTDVATVQTTADAIEADTQDLQSRTPAALVGGRTDASVGAMAANTITAAAAAADLTTEFVAGIFAKIVDNLTVNQILGLLEATLTAKMSGMNTTSPVVRNPDDTLDRIAWTNVDADGNRPDAPTLDLTGL